VRDALRFAGLDNGNMDSSAWNPLGQWVSPGSSVFVLPNFVTHRREDESRDAFLAKCTHANVLRAVLDYARIAAGPDARIQFGNAPIQSADYGRTADENGVTAMTSTLERLGRPVEGPFDLRQLVTQWTRFGAKISSDIRPEETVSFDLGEGSWLEPLYQSGAQVQFRVGDYNPDETAAYHGPGRHVYVMSRRVLESDVIISVPKLKTHQKVGITCALKGTVGTIARKECLAHHRRGGPAESGDEFPRSGPVRRMASDLADHAAARGSSIVDNAVRVTSKLLYRALRVGPAQVTAGSWSGNDTAWRMVLDIARILRFGRLDGTLAGMPQREHIAFIDGIVAGDAEGPLRPEPVHAGVVLFGSDPVWTDHACAAVMGFDAARMPLLVNARSAAASLTAATEADVEFRNSDGIVSLNGLRPLGIPSFAPPKGWPNLRNSK
jgi:uncharacterized protein (DUF362 family)